MKWRKTLKFWKKLQTFLIEFRKKKRCFLKILLNQKIMINEFLEIMANVGSLHVVEIAKQPQTSDGHELARLASWLELGRFFPAWLDSKQALLHILPIIKTGVLKVYFFKVKSSSNTKSLTRSCSARLGSLCFAVGSAQLEFKNLARAHHYLRQKWPKTRCC